VKAGFGANYVYHGDRSPKVKQPAKVNVPSRDVGEQKKKRKNPETAQVVKEGLSLRKVRLIDTFSDFHSEKKGEGFIHNAEGKEKQTPTLRKKVHKSPTPGGAGGNLWRRDCGSKGVKDSPKKKKKGTRIHETQMSQENIGFDRKIITRKCEVYMGHRPKQ